MLVNKYVTGNPVPTNEKWRAVPPLQIERVEQGHQFWHGDVRRNTFRPYVRKPELEGGLPEGVTLRQSKSQVQILCRQVPAGVLTVQLHASVGGDTVRFFAKSMAGFDLATVAWHFWAQVLPAPCGDRDEVAAHAAEQAVRLAGAAVL